MRYYGKFCIVCGRRIPELSLKRRTCSDFCRSRYKCGYAPYKNYTALPYDDLTSLQEEAHERGMSYGKYMAMKYNEPQTNRKERTLVCR